jgi:hypothetical protein
MPFFLKKFKRAERTEKNGGPYRIRTYDLPLRRRLLYPAELRVRNVLVRPARLELA